MAHILGASVLVQSGLGTVLKLPMSTVTIVEDVGMVAIVGWMLPMVV